MGDKSPLAPKASSAMESTGGVCPMGGPHTFKFGMCNKCKISEGRVIKSPGAVSNPGGSVSTVCPQGGKHMFKFSKCSKCGASEM
jgi:rRNA maturation protein Nop10